MPEKDHKLFFLITLLTLSFNPGAANAQGLGEFGGLNASMAGMGAGAAAAAHGQLSHTKFANLALTQQSITVQNKNVEQFFKMGNQFECQKQWQQAEKAFTSMLKAIALRDGSGSPKSVPALKHLASISDAQDKIDQAISYQKTVLAFTKAGKVPARSEVVQEALTLSDLLIKKADYSAAEPLLRESAALAKQPPVLPKERRRTLIVLGRVCRALNKQEEAMAVARELEAEAPEEAAVETVVTPAAAVPINSSKVIHASPITVQKTVQTTRQEAPVSPAATQSQIDSGATAATSAVQPTEPPINSAPINSAPTAPAPATTTTDSASSTPNRSDTIPETVPPTNDDGKRPTQTESAGDPIVIPEQALPDAK